MKEKNIFYLMRGMKNTQKKTIEHYLKGLSFPVNKEELLDEAEHNKAPFNVIDVLTRFEDKVYRSVRDISEESKHIKSKDFEKFCNRLSC